MSYTGYISHLHLHPNKKYKRLEITTYNLFLEFC